MKKKTLVLAPVAAPSENRKQKPAPASSENRKQTPPPGNSGYSFDIFTCYFSNEKRRLKSSTYFPLKFYQIFWEKEEMRWRSAKVIVFTKFCEIRWRNEELKIRSFFGRNASKDFEKAFWSNLLVIVYSAEMSKLFKKKFLLTQSYENFFRSLG